MIAEGFEPSTVCLEGRCSIQLSYATLLFHVAWRNCQSLTRLGSYATYFAGANIQLTLINFQYFQTKCKIDLKSQTVHHYHSSFSKVYVSENQLPVILKRLMISDAVGGSKLDITMTKCWVSVS